MNLSLACLTSLVDIVIILHANVTVTLGTEDRDYIINHKFCIRNRVRVKQLMTDVKQVRIPIHPRYNKVNHFT
jgi:hypothetical protein